MREFAELHERMGRGELSFRQAVVSGRASSAASTAAAAWRGLFVVTSAEIAEHASLPRDSHHPLRRRSGRAVTTVNFPRLGPSGDGAGAGQGG
jgi:hypothetical protein